MTILLTPVSLQVFNMIYEYMVILMGNVVFSPYVEVHKRLFLLNMRPHS